VPAKQHTGGGRGRHTAAKLLRQLQKKGRCGMPGLKCRAVDCAYNMEQFCSARTIRVGRNPSAAYCDTYTQNSPAATAARHRLLDGLNTEFGADIGPPKIACTASECAYNKAFRCHAGRVEIDDAQNSVLASCLTYRPK